MARINKQQKQETEDKIIEVSKKLFLSNGYSNTNMNQIASEVGIAVGTIFNYFETKADLFMKVIISDQGITQSTDDYLTYDLTFPASDIIMQYVNNVLEKILMMPKKMLIELSAAMLSKASAKKDITNDLVQIDKLYIKKLVEFICYLKKMGAIVECNCEVIGECIFGVIVMEMIVFLNIKSKTSEEVLKNIREKIAIILNGYLL